MADSKKIGNTGLEKVVKPDIEGLLSEPEKKIQLHKLVQKQTEVAYKSVEELNVQTEDVLSSAQKAVKIFETSTQDLRNMIAYGCYFGTPEQAYLWNSALSRLSTVPKAAGSVFLLNLQLYPALLVFYAGGLSALASKNAINLKAIFSVKSTDKTREPQALAAVANSALLGNAGNQVFGTERLKTPLSDHLYGLFNKAPLTELAFGQDINELFDQWEILVSMVAADALLESAGFGAGAPMGRFSWKETYVNASAINILKKELENNEPDWFPLTAGLFDKSPERARRALDVVKDVANRTNFF